MKRVEQYIKDYTRNCSNEIIGWDKNMFPIYQDWLTPDQARKAVEIAREEIIKDILHKLSVFLDNKDDRDYYTVGYIKRHLEDLKKHLEEPHEELEKGRKEDGV